MSDVEFSSLIEEWFFYVLLEDEGFMCAISMSPSFSDDGFDLIESEADDDAITSVGEFSRFDDPHVIIFFCFFLFLIKIS